MYSLLLLYTFPSGRHLPTPNETHWNAAFDCLEVFMFQDLESLNKALIVCGIRALIPTEVSFLKEYLIVMKPVSITLDCFQAEKNCYLGMVLPAIVKLKRRLNELTELHSFSEYRDLLVEKINLRFGHLFKDDNHILSAATHPQFKLNWIEDEFTKLEVKKKLDNLLTLDGKQQKLISPVESSNFLNFNTNSSCLTEVDHFLTNESRDFKCFDKCPNIKSKTALSDMELHFPNKRIQNEALSLNAGVKETKTGLRKF